MIPPVEVVQEEDGDYSRAIEAIILTLTPPPYTRIEHLYCLIRCTGTIYVYNQQRICDLCYEQTNRSERRRFIKTASHCLCNYMGLLRGSICVKCGIGMVFRRPAQNCTECINRSILLNSTEKTLLLQGNMITVENID